VSEHLRVLRTVGLLELQQRGRFWIYRTSPAVVGSVATALVEMAGL
jgi:hypothetical protein